MWFYHQPFGHNTHNTYDTSVNLRARSYKVIEICCNRKPIYDFLLVINCHLSSISNSFRDIAKPKTTHPSLSSPPRSRGPLLISSNMAAEETRHCATFLWKPHDPYFSHCHNTLALQTTTDNISLQKPAIAMKLQRSANNTSIKSYNNKHGYYNNNNVVSYAQLHTWCYCYIYSLQSYWLIKTQDTA